MVEIVISISIVTVCGLCRFQVAGAGLDSDLGFGLRSGVDDGHRRPTRPRIGVRARVLGQMQVGLLGAMSKWW